MWSKEEKKTQDTERIINSEFELQFERAILWSDPLPTYIWTGSSRKTLLQMKCSVVLPLYHMFVLPSIVGWPWIQTFPRRDRCRDRVLGRAPGAQALALLQQSSLQGPPEFPLVVPHGSWLSPQLVSEVPFILASCFLLSLQITLIRACAKISFAKHTFERSAVLLASYGVPASPGVSPHKAALLRGSFQLWVNLGQ